jgi:hypothetical protein
MLSVITLSSFASADVCLAYIFASCSLAFVGLYRVPKPIMNWINWWKFETFFAFPVSEVDAIMFVF